MFSGAERKYQRGVGGVASGDMAGMA